MLQVRRDWVGAAAKVKIVREVKGRVLHSVRHLTRSSKRRGIRVGACATTYTTARASFTVCSISRDPAPASLFGTAQCTASGRPWHSLARRQRPCRPGYVATDAIRFLWALRLRKPTATTSDEKALRLGTAALWADSESLCPTDGLN